METNFKIWKTIKVGTIKNPYELLGAISGLRNVKEGFDFKNIDFGRISISNNVEEIDLVVVNSVELGLNGDNSYVTICDAAEKFGLIVCPQETGLQLILQINDSDKKVYRMTPVIASKSIESSNLDYGSMRFFFQISADDDIIRIDGKDIQSHYVWSAHRKFIFCKKK